MPGPEPPAEDNRKRGPWRNRGREKVSCEDCVSPGHSGPFQGHSNCLLAGAHQHIRHQHMEHPTLLSPYLSPARCTHHSEQCLSHPLAQPRLSKSLAVPRDLCPLHRCGDHDPEREGNWFPDCCRVLVLGVCPQLRVGCHWTSHESPTHPGRVWHLLGTEEKVDLQSSGPNHGL